MSGLPLRFSLLAVCSCVLLTLAVSPGWAECDIDGPILTDFALGPDVVDVTLSSVEVTCEMTFTDVPGGVDEATCVLTPTIFVVQRKSCVAQEPSAGDRSDGTFTCSVNIPRYSFPGTWDASVLSVDTVGNESQVSTPELHDAGLPATVLVTSSPDLLSPVLTDFDFEPQTLNVSTGSQDVVCTMQLQDPLAGVVQANCGFTAPGFTQGQTCFAFEPIAGTPQDGTFACTLTIPQYADAATWSAFVLATDAVDNLGASDSATLQGLGFPAELTVVSTPEDLQPPQLVSFEFSPDAIDVASQSRMVNCEMTVADSPAGVFAAGCQFTSPGELINHSCVSFAPSTGTPQEGTFGCAVSIPRYSEQGIWKADVVVIDSVFNTPLSLDAPSLAAMGLPTDLSIDCQGPADLLIRFEASDSLIWNPITQALRYNVYRGDLAAMVDDDFDGQPDGGYGTCVNDADPDPTDTLFLDPDVPPATEGFTYLASYLLESGEVGLGSNSGGMPRVVPPCP